MRSLKVATAALLLLGFGLAVSKGEVLAGLRSEIWGTVKTYGSPDSSQYASFEQRARRRPRYPRRASKDHDFERYGPSLRSLSAYIQDSLERSGSLAKGEGGRYFAVAVWAQAETMLRFTEPYAADFDTGCDVPVPSDSCARRPAMVLERNLIAPAFLPEVNDHEDQISSPTAAGPGVEGHGNEGHEARKIFTAPQDFKVGVAALWMPRNYPAGHVRTLDERISSTDSFNSAAKEAIKHCCASIKPISMDKPHFLHCFDDHVKETSPAMHAQMAAIVILSADANSGAHAAAQGGATMLPFKVIYLLPPKDDDDPMDEEEEDDHLRVALWTLILLQDIY